MSSKAALGLEIEPGEYMCQWKIPGLDGHLRELPGSLTIEAGRPPLATAHGDVPVIFVEKEGERSMAFPQTRQFDLLQGRLLSGWRCCLFDARVETWAPERAIIHAQAAGVGGPTAPPKVDKFAMMKMQLTGLDGINQEPPIKRVTFPKTPGRHLEGTWSAEGNPESSQEWIAENATVRLEFDGALRVSDPYSYRLGFSPVLSVRVASAISLNDWLRLWIEPLRRITCLATGRQESLTFLALGGGSEEGATRWLQIFGSGVSQEPFESTWDCVRRIKPVVRFGDRGGESLLEAVRRWQETEAAHHPLVETYGAILGAPAQPPRAMFQLLVQALEGLHGYLSEEERSTRVERHQSRREGVLLSVAPHVSVDDYRFLEKNLLSHPRTSVDEALRSTVASLPVDVGPRLAASDLVRTVRTENPRLSDWADALRVARNDLAHGRRGFESAALSEVVHVLEAVIRAHLLRVLGVDAGAERKALDQAHAS